jgi:CRP/FNR family cyclic AMP-dependent transcriptional regulator
MSILSILEQADIFDGLHPEHLELIASISTLSTYNYNDVIFEETSMSDELFVIARGEVDILINPTFSDDLTAEPTPIVTMRRGEVFGEIALVDQGTRSASARSVQQGTEVVVIPRAGLISLCETNPELGYRLMSRLAIDLARKIRSSDLRMKTWMAW